MYKSNNNVTVHSLVLITHHIQKCGACLKARWKESQVKWGGVWADVTPGRNFTY